MWPNNNPTFYPIKWLNSYVCCKWQTFSLSQVSKWLMKMDFCSWHYCLWLCITIVSWKTVRLQRGNRKYQTSSALCNPTTCTQKFSEYYLCLHGILNDPSVEWRYWRLNDLFCSDATATGAAKIANAFEWPGQPPKIAPSPWGICTHAWFWGLTRVFIQNGMLIGSAVFVLYIVPLLYNGQLHLPPKLPLPLEGSGPPSNTWYLEPTQVIDPIKIAHSPWTLITPLEEDWATVIGNIEKNL